MFGRHHKQTYSQVMMDELNEGFDHLWQAGAAAAAGMGATFGPKWANTRIAMGPPAHRFRDAASQSWESTVSTLGPLVGLAREEARRANRQMRTEKAMKRGRPMSRKRAFVALGLVAVGAGTGAVAAMIVRRRRRAQWEEFDARAAVDMAQGEAVLVDSPERETVPGAEGVADGSRSGGATGAGARGTGDGAKEERKQPTSAFAAGAGQESKNGRPS